MITAAFLQLGDNVLQRRIVSELYLFPDVVLSSVLSGCPEPESSDQICCLSNEVARG